MLVDSLGEFRVEEVVGRQVHRQPEVVAAVVDLAEMADATVEHDIGELLDQPRVLSHPDELGRWHDAADGMGPTHECLCTDDRAGGEVELGLQVNAKSVSLDCRAEVAEHREASGGATIDLVAVHVDAEALRLGVVHGDVGVPERDTVFVVTLDHGHTCAGGDDDLEPVERDRATDVADALPGELDHLGVSPSACDDGELITGQPRQHVVGAEHRRQPGADLDEQFVAGVVAERVVDLLETVEIDHDHEQQIIRRPDPWPRR